MPGVEGEAGGHERGGQMGGGGVEWGGWHEGGGGGEHGGGGGGVKGGVWRLSRVPTYNNQILKKGGGGLFTPCLCSDLLFGQKLVFFFILDWNFCHDNGSIKQRYFIL